MHLVMKCYSKFCLLFLGLRVKRRRKYNILYIQKWRLYYTFPYMKERENYIREWKCIGIFAFTYHAFILMFLIVIVLMCEYNRANIVFFFYLIRIQI